MLLIRMNISQILIVVKLYGIHSLALNIDSNEIWLNAVLSTQKQKNTTKGIKDDLTRFLGCGTYLNRKVIIKYQNI